MKHRFLLALLYLTLCACGIKPGQVSAPDTSKADEFPHTYPSPKTDPHPL